MLSCPCNLAVYCREVMNKDTRGVLCQTKRVNNLITFLEKHIWINIFLKRTHKKKIQVGHYADPTSRSALDCLRLLGSSI